MTSPVPLHRRPNESCLEPFREAITERRLKRWPYRRIAAWLNDDHDLVISWVSIRNFCIVRNIVKGVGQVTEEEPIPSTALTQPQPSKRRAPAKDSDWEFYTDGPIDIHRNLEH